MENVDNNLLLSIFYQPHDFLWFILAWFRFEFVNFIPSIWRNKPGKLFDIMISQFPCLQKLKQNEWIKPIWKQRKYFRFQFHCVQNALIVAKINYHFFMLLLLCWAPTRTCLPSPLTIVRSTHRLGTWSALLLVRHR